MTERRNRASNRVFFHAPARIRGHGGTFEARIEDISWSGVRLRLERSTLDLKEDAGIGAAAGAAECLLGDAFPVSLDTGPDGAHLVKRVRVIRLAMPDKDPDHLDVGCLFEERLAEREAEELGLAMPVELRHAGNSVRRAADWKHEHTSRLDPDAIVQDVEGVDGWEDEGGETQYVPRVPLRAVITNVRAHGTEPIVCSAESFTVNTLLVRARVEMMPFNHRWDRQSVAQAAVSFSEQYGDRIGLEVVSGTRRVWQGPMHVFGVEVDPEQPRDILLHMGFGRPLLKAEIKQLRHGGATDAA